MLTLHQSIVDAWWAPFQPTEMLYASGHNIIMVGCLLACAKNINYEKIGVNIFKLFFLQFLFYYFYGIQ